MSAYGGSFGMGGGEALSTSVHLPGRRGCCLGGCVNLSSLGLFLTAVVVYGALKLVGVV